MNKLDTVNKQLWKDGICYKCGSKRLRDKGSYEKCLDCGERIVMYDEVGEE